MGLLELVAHQLELEIGIEPHVHARDLTDRVIVGTEITAGALQSIHRAVQEPVGDKGIEATDDDGKPQARGRQLALQFAVALFRAGRLLRFGAFQ